jgi:hypothetical protein
MEDPIGKYLNKLFIHKTNRRRVAMIYFTILNVAIAAVSILSFGYQMGWEKLTEFPFILLWMVLFVFGFFAFWLRWDEIKEEEIEKKQSEEAVKELTKSINDLVKRIDERWPK